MKLVSGNPPPLQKNPKIKKKNLKNPKTKQAKKPKAKLNRNKEARALTSYPQIKLIARKQK